MGYVMVYLHLRYYVVEFCKEDAVSIRQREKLSCKSRMWGEGRLAVEGVAFMSNICVGHL